MKMADGGFRPAFNVQMATAGSELGGSRTVVGVQVTNVGSDMNAVTPMLDQIERRTGHVPETYLADANHGSHTGIIDAATRGVNLLVATPKRTRQKRSAEPDKPAIAEWKARMESEDAKALYRSRASLCEWTNAQTAERFGLRRFLVRSLPKATSVALLVAITVNLTQHLATLAP